MSSAASKRSRAAPARRAKVSATPEKQRIPYSHGPYQAKANNRLFLDGDRAADVQWRAWGPCRRHDSGCRRPQCAARCDDAAAPQRLLSPTARCQRLAKRGTANVDIRETLAVALLILVYFLMGCVRQPEVFLLVAAVAGVAWTVAASELWVAGQFAAPKSARGRLNAAYMMASNASMAIGGIVWGALAAFKGLEFALHAGPILLLISLPLLFRFSIDVVQGRDSGA